MSDDINKDENTAMLKSISEELDKSCDRLDGQTLSRLNKVRHDALNNTEEKGFSKFFFPGSLIATCLLAVVVINQAQLSGAIEQSVLDVSAEDAEIWASSESLEFFEDLEFYQWLVENDPSV